MKIFIIVAFILNRKSLSSLTSISILTSCFLVLSYLSYVRKIIVLIGVSLTFSSFLLTTARLLFSVVCWLLTGQGRRETWRCGRRWIYINTAMSSDFWVEPETDERQLRIDSPFVLAEICFVWWINFRNDDGVAARQGFIKTQTPLLMVCILCYLQFITMRAARPVWSMSSVSTSPGVWRGQPQINRVWSTRANNLENYTVS